MLKLTNIIQVNDNYDGEHRIAVQDEETSLTWADLAFLTRLWVLRILSIGRAVFLSENRAELVPLAAAFSTTGRPFVGIDYSLPIEKKLHAARAISAEAVIASPRFAEDAAVISRELSIPAVNLMAEVKKLPRDQPSSLPDLPSHPFTSFSFTSGTTGPPKAVYRSKSFEARRFTDLQALFDFNDTARFLPALPFYHASASGWARLFLNLGGQIVLADVSDAGKMARALVEQKVTALLATPAVLEQLLSHLARDYGKPKDLRFILTGGKHLPRDLSRRAIDFFGPILHEYWGTTESGLNTIADSHDLLEHPGSSGRPLDGNQILILDDADMPLPAGQPGRVAVSSYQMFDGYCSGPAVSFVQVNGLDFFVTPDVGYMRDGRLFLLNRTFTGESTRDVYAIEDRLRDMSGVRDVFAVALNDQVLRVFVVATTHAQRRVREQVGRWNDGSADFDIQLKFLPEICYSPSGKVRIDMLLCS